MKFHGKFSASPHRRNRTCPICGKRFDAKNNNFALCNRCKQMCDKGGKHRRQRFDR